MIDDTFLIKQCTLDNPMNPEKKLRVYKLVKRVRAPKDYPGKVHLIGKTKEKYVYLHYLTWWKNTGEVVQEHEEVIHLDGNKDNNEFSNLSKQPRYQKGLQLSRLARHAESDRMKSHFLKNLEKTCVTCNRVFTPRVKIAKNCSPECVEKYLKTKR